MSDWIQWHGGECPVSEDTVVEACINGVRHNHTRPARDFDWAHDVGIGNIVAYRVVEPDTSRPGKSIAEGYLEHAAAEMRDRAASRDQADGERSMRRAVRAFWEIYGDAILNRGHMTETEGWEFMSVLKKVRGAQGEYREDDYVDDIAYCALAAESASDLDR